MSKKPVITTEEWVDAMFSVNTDRPSNSFTAEDIMKKTGLTRCATVHKLNDLVDKGQLTKGKFYNNSRLFNYYVPVVKKNIIKKKK